MLDTQKIAQRNRDKTGKEQRQPDVLAIGGSRQQVPATSGGDPMQVE